MSRRRNSANAPAEADPVLSAASYMTPQAILAAAKPSRSESKWGRYAKKGARTVMFPLGTSVSKVGVAGTAFLVGGGPIGAGTAYLAAEAADRLTREEEAEYRAADAAHDRRERNRRKNGRARAKPKGSRVQSLIFDRAVFTRPKAEAWARKHGFDARGIDPQPNTWRIRQADPADFDPRTYGTITLRPGVQAVVAVPR